MGRKSKRGFDWVADDAEGEAREPVVRRNRSEEKRRRKRLKNLASELAELSPGHRRQLPIDEELREALEELVASRPTPNRRRKLLRLQGLLAEEDDETIDAILAAVDG